MKIRKILEKNQQKHNQQLKHIQILYNNRIDGVLIIG